MGAQADLCEVGGALWVAGGCWCAGRSLMWEADCQSMLEDTMASPAKLHTQTELSSLL